MNHLKYSEDFEKIEFGFVFIIYVTELWKKLMKPKSSDIIKIRLN